MNRSYVGHFQVADRIFTEYGENGRDLLSRIGWFDFVPIPGSLETTFTFENDSESIEGNEKSRNFERRT